MVSLPNTTNALPSQNSTLADGSLVVSGTLTNALTGARSAQSQQFEVQSSAVWRQYSEIDTTSGNAFFGQQNASTGNLAPRLPGDAGQLAIAAQTKLLLQATLLAAPAAGGRNGSVDIASQDIQIVGPNAAAALGYIQISASDLSNFAGPAGTLVIGGTVTFGNAGETITPVANSVEISNDAGHALSAAEIILVAAPVASDLLNANGIVNSIILDSNSAIRASGTLASGATTAITVAGDGALIRVANGAAATVSRSNIPAAPQGIATIGAGATLAGDFILLELGGRVEHRVVHKADRRHRCAGHHAVRRQHRDRQQRRQRQRPRHRDQRQQRLLRRFARRLAAAPRRDGHGDQQRYDRLPRLGRSGAGAEHEGGAGIDFDAATLLAVPVTGNSGAVSIAANTVTLTNSGAAATASPSSGSATLAITADELDLEPGKQSLVRLRRLQRIGRSADRAAGLGRTGRRQRVGRPDVIAAPRRHRCRTVDHHDRTLTIGGTSAAVIAGNQIGGQLTLTAGTISDNGVIQALAGSVTLEATAGDVTLGQGSEILAAGFAQQFFDTVSIADGGIVKLLSDQGNIAVMQGATIDVSRPPPCPRARSSCRAEMPVRSFSRRSRAAWALRNAAWRGAERPGRQLHARQQQPRHRRRPDHARQPGADPGRRRVQRRDQHPHTVGRPRARPADEGAIGVAHRRWRQSDDRDDDRRLRRPGRVHHPRRRVRRRCHRGDTAGERHRLRHLGARRYRRHRDELRRRYMCRHRARRRRGSNQARHHRRFGQRPVERRHCRFRAPIFFVTGGGTVVVNPGIDQFGELDFNEARVRIQPNGVAIKGAQTVAVEAYTVFDAANPNSGFDGIIDPAGLYGSNDQPLASGTNQQHINFWTSIAAYVQNFALPQFAGVTGVELQPGIELDNSSASVNSGNITVASALNLGAVKSINTADPALSALDFHVGVPTSTSGNVLGAPGVLTLRAENNVVIGASITDGFIHVSDQATVPGVGTVGSPQYDPAANGISPVPTTNDVDPIVGAESSH